MQKYAVLNQERTAIVAWTSDPDGGEEVAYTGCGRMYERIYYRPQEVLMVSQIERPSKGNRLVEDCTNDD